MIDIKFNELLDNYAVLGNPIKHSKSPEIHSLFAKQTTINIYYQSLEVPLTSFNDYVYAFLEKKGKGLNVTVPFKEQAFKICTHHTKRAISAGSVNTLWFGTGATIYGDTTDGKGFINDLIYNHKVEIKNKSVLILGAGGSVRAIIEPLLKQAPKEICIVNRTLTKAKEIAQMFTGEIHVTYCSYEQLNNQSFDIVINGTSLSLQAKLPPLPKTLLNKNACCYDLMYSYNQTVFMQWAKSNGASLILDGLGMLVEQAAESFNIWHKVKPNTKEVIRHLRKNQK